MGWLRVARAVVGPRFASELEEEAPPKTAASRITQVARPGSLLADREVRESASEDYRWSYAGERRLRGVREPVSLFRARRLDA